MDCGSAVPIPGKFGKYFSGIKSAQAQSGTLRRRNATLDDGHAQLRFRQEILPHMDAAYNMARWIVGSDADAQDVVQEAVLRAFKSFDRWRGGNGRAWLLTIVRNCSYDWRRSNRRQREIAEFDESSHIGDDSTEPGAILDRQLDSAMLHTAITALPAEYREVIVLREFEQLDYKQMADVIGVPIGTVMSRLARARQRLRTALQKENGQQDGEAS
jgi:RNA polymerase sigma-70 factor (ECF subfamily)